MKSDIVHIKSNYKWYEFNIKELLEYKDLLFMFVKDSLVSSYKQTILGPLWLIINPLITTVLYTLVFGNIAKLSTDGIPEFIFYLAGNAIWSYFQICVSRNANTFIENSSVMGKVYFPRLIMPISAVITALVNLLVQVIILFISMVVFSLMGVEFNISMSILLVPVLIIQTAMFGLGCGIIVSSTTTVFRDLVSVVNLFMQLWMYASPVVYPISEINNPILYKIYMLNPMAPIITAWRSVIFGLENIPYFYWGISIVVTIIVLIIGVTLFNKVEKSFMDTI